MMKINCHSDFQPLKEIIVGRSYHQDSFDFIKESQIRNPLKRILEETEEDFRRKTRGHGGALPGPGCRRRQGEGTVDSRLGPVLAPFARC